MADPLRVLLVEDSDDDAVLLERELQAGGLNVETLRVATPEAVAEALKRPWDVVITDHNLPGFSSADVLQRVHDTGLDSPVIIVSGIIGEDVAVASMKAGAHDYIMKGNLARLVPAVERELREASARRARRQAEETMRHMALHDALTGLANRRELQERVEQALASARRGARHALLYIDLDQFKIVNDTCGHVAGDELLRQLAMLLHEPIRDADTLARLGGDEFGVLLLNCALDQAQEAGERILSLVRNFHYVWAGKTFTLGASIGLVVIDGEGQTFTDVLRAADLACYAAKDKGRNRMHLYLPDDADLKQRRGEMEWLGRINHALKTDGFILHSQPIIGLHNGLRQARAQEFLLRMQGSDGDAIPPGAFIPAAERYNLMPAVDRWVTRHALDAVSRWQSQIAPRSEDTFFLNLSATTLSDADFCAELHTQIRRTNVPPEAICFEITETAAVANLATALTFIQEAKMLGCRIALDDFGVGHSSFSYLKTIPADIVKIDGSFVQGMLRDPIDTAIVQSIYRVASVAGLKVVAEWVENESLLNTLSELGIDYAQGFGIARPTPIRLH